MVIVACLFVAESTVYRELDGCDPWPAGRDATQYPGTHPVVAHPPCARWCRLAGLVEARWGIPRGEDGGLFASALGSVRRWGGVLEHPAYSDAWPAHGLPQPHFGPGWQRGTCGGWACHVEQSRYGHRAKKATWLYHYSPAGYPPSADLRWGCGGDVRSDAPVSWCGNRTRAGDTRPRLGKAESAATPPAFAAELVRLARAAREPSRGGGHPGR